MSNKIDTPMARLKRFENTFETESYLRHQMCYPRLREAERRDIQQKLDIAVELRHLCTGYREALECNKATLVLAVKATKQAEKYMDSIIGHPSDLAVELYRNVQAIQEQLTKTQEGKAITR